MSETAFERSRAAAPALSAGIAAFASRHGLVNARALRDAVQRATG